MQQPAGYVDQTRPHYVCRLQKSLYGLKQAPYVYVDDIIIVGSQQSAVDKLLHQLQDSFAVKDLGPLTYFLGVEILHYNKARGFLVRSAIGFPIAYHRSTRPLLVLTCLFGIGHSIVINF